MRLLDAIQWRFNQKSIRQALVATLILILFVEVPAFLYVSSNYSNQLEKDQDKQIEDVLRSRSNSLSLAVTQRLSLIEAIEAFLSVNKSSEYLDENFVPFVSDIYETYEGIRNIAIAPNGTQTYVYPVEGNEETVGHNLLNDSRPQVQEDINRMLETQNVTLSGPYELRQGGQGLIIRKPIYEDNSFWGIISMVVDMVPIYELSSLGSQQGLVQIAIRNWRSNVFYGDPAIFEQHPVMVNSTLPEFSWELGGIPSLTFQNQVRRESIIFDFIIGAILAGIAGVTYLLINRHKRLEAKVKQRNREFIELEKQVYKQEKLESLGILAGGIAHDFNNIITVILGYNELIGNISDDKRIKQYVDKIQDTIDDSKTMIDHLLMYTGKTKYEPERFDLKSIVENTQSLIQASIDESIDISIVYPDQTLMIEGAPAQIKQVLFNLCLNAADAIDHENGEITIEMKELRLDDRKIGELNLDITPGRYALLRVEDNGQGIEDDIIEQIFDPFFSTKEVGRGLGLATVFGIVKSHEGEILVDSDLREGSVFSVFLPIAENDNTEYTPAEPQKQLSYTFEDDVVLICEDDLKIMEIMEQALTKEGIRVLTAMDGRQALRMYHDNKGDLSLIITDLVIPKLRGEKLIQKIREDDDIGIIVISGYSPSDEKIVDEANNIYFLQKPFKPADLLQLIHTMLSP